MKRSFPIVAAATLAFLAAMPLRAAVNGDWGELCDPAVALSAFDLMGEMHEKMGDAFGWLVDREPSLSQRLLSPMKTADGKLAPAPTVSAAKPAPVKPTAASQSSASNQSTSTFQRVLAAHEKAIVSVHTAVWKALPKPWELLQKSGAPANAARPAAKGEAAK
jgi:hypothetical protein